MPWTILSPTIIVGWTCVLIGLERLFPYQPQRRFRAGFFTEPARYGLHGENHPKRGFFAYLLQYAHSLRRAKEISDG